MRWGLLAIALTACVRTNPNVVGELPDDGVVADLAMPMITVDLAKPGAVDDLMMPLVEAGTVTKPDLGGNDLAGVDLAGADFAMMSGPDMAIVVMCGDNRCDSGEDCITCPGDCGACVCEAKRASCDGVPGCEVDVNAVDEGEPENDSCSGRTMLGLVNENSMKTVTTHRLLGAGDADTFSLTFKEGTHFCAGGSQGYKAVATVTGPGGTTLQMRSSTSTCNDTWGPTQEVGVCFSWTGACFATDDLPVSLQVLGASSCMSYKLQISFCAIDSMSCCTDEGCCN